MAIAESAVNEALKSEDAESLIEAGAPEDEYMPEARGIVKAMVLIDEKSITEEALAAVIREVWSRSFGPFYDDDLEMRMPAFRQAAQRILPRNS